MDSDLPILSSEDFRLLPAKIFRSVPWNILRVWMHFEGVYCLPTLELIDFLKKEIGDDKAIEIGSGCGLLGRFLEIPMTDSKIQSKNEVRIYYELTGQPIIKYPDIVEELDAEAAIEKYKPDVVIGSWITRWIDPNLKPPSDGCGGSMYGVKEDKIISKTKKYIHIGSEAIHHYKLQNNPDRIIEADWIVSRSNRGDDVIYIWEK